MEQGRGSGEAVMIDTFMDTREVGKSAAKQQGSIEYIYYQHA